MTRPQPIEFGIFDWLDMGGMSLTDKYEQRLKCVPVCMSSDQRPGR